MVFLNQDAEKPIRTRAQIEQDKEDLKIDKITLRNYDHRIKHAKSNGAPNELLSWMQNAYNVLKSLIESQDKYIAEDELILGLSTRAIQ